MLQRPGDKDDTFSSLHSTTRSQSTTIVLGLLSEYMASICKEAAHGGDWVEQTLQQETGGGFATVSFLYSTKTPDCDDERRRVIWNETTL